MVQVKTKAELKKAINDGEPIIEILDSEIANQLKILKQVKKLSKWTIIIVLTIATTVLIGGTVITRDPKIGLKTSAKVAQFVAYRITTPGGYTISAEAIAAIIFFGFLGVAMLYAIYKDYDIEIDGHRVILRRKKKEE